ncbi:MAG: hypothetical protein MHMPM18_003701 [Marteilia pararefringens]
MTAERKLYTHREIVDSLGPAGVKSFMEKLQKCKNKFADMNLYTCACMLNEQFKLDSTETTNSIRATAKLLKIDQHENMDDKSVMMLLCNDPYVRNSHAIKSEFFIIPEPEQPEISAPVSVKANYFEQREQYLSQDRSGLAEIERQKREAEKKRLEEEKRKAAFEERKRMFE